jgi:hypothetical protein
MCLMQLPLQLLQPGCFDVGLQRLQPEQQLGLQAAAAALIESGGWVMLPGQRMHCHFEQQTGAAVVVVR